MHDSGTLLWDKSVKFKSSFIHFVQVLKCLGTIQVLRNAMGGGGVRVPEKKRYERVWFNVLSVRGSGWLSNIKEKCVA